MIPNYNWYVEIKNLDVRHYVTKLDSTFYFTILLRIDINLSIQVCITCVVHDLGALGNTQKIQVIGSL